MGISNWNAGIIRPVPVAPAGPYETGAAPGVWTLDQVAYWQKQGLWPIAGNTQNFIEDMFSTTLYTGNGTTQTITNGVNLSGNGGLVWSKSRSSVLSHVLVDTVRGSGLNLSSDTTAAQSNPVLSVTSFLADGYTLGSRTGSNDSGVSFASWTFREQPKFFDVVTWTGDNVSGRAIPHNLGSVPGCIIVKGTNNTQNWVVWHRSLSAGQFMLLNGTNAVNTNSAIFTTTTPTSTEFYVGSDAASNSSTFTYVAYVFAHNAGGFGLTGTDNVISCGSYTGNNGLQTVNLGYEAQWVLIKNASDVYNWSVYDNMRGMAVGAVNNPVLYPNTTAAEAADRPVYPTSTGFAVNTAANIVNATGNTYIYIAVRRGPMKTPTLATTVFGISARTGTGANATVTGGSGVDDAVLVKNRGAAVASLVSSRLTGTEYLVTSTTAAGVAAGATILQANPWDVMDGVKVGTTSTITNASANTFVNYLFSRAPGFFDVVCDTGTSASHTINHNLTAKPQLMIRKNRNNVGVWFVYVESLGYATINALNDAFSPQAVDPSYWFAEPTSSVFSVGTNGTINVSGTTYLTYLFATLAGVSKVGSYTGTAALQTVACGFAAGARFVMIKRTDSTGDWYYWDSVRGLSSGNDPYLLMNTTAAEVTGTNYVDTDTTGFKVTAAAPAALNAVGGTYIFLAIA